MGYGSEYFKRRAEEEAQREVEKRKASDRVKARFERMSAKQKYETDSSNGMSIKYIFDLPDKENDNEIVTDRKLVFVHVTYKGEDEWVERTESNKSQKFLVVNGPKAGKKMPQGDDERYHLYNRSSRWRSSRDLPTAVLVYAPSLRKKQ